MEYNNYRNYCRYLVGIKKEELLNHNFDNSKLLNFKGFCLSNSESRLLYGYEIQVKNTSSHSCNKILKNNLEINNCSQKILESSNNDIIPLGLINRNHFCYMNSVIQSLRNCHEFVNCALSWRLECQKIQINSSNKDDIKLVSAFFDLIHDLAYRNTDLLKQTSLVFQNSHENFPEFAKGEQDADEYLQFLLNKLNDVIKSNSKGKNKSRCFTFRSKINHQSKENFVNPKILNNSFITQLFCGQMNNQLTCKNCQFKKPSLQVFWVLSVPIMYKNDSENESSLENCVKSLEISQRVFDHKCSRCKSTDTMYMSTYVTAWPKYLILNVKRNLQTGNMKNKTLIDWPLNKHLTISTNQSLFRYTLLGVIDHIGSVINGHYIAKFRDLNDFNLWWCYNDNCVSEVKSPNCQIITGNTTTYFFQR